MVWPDLILVDTENQAILALPSVAIQSFLLTIVKRRSISLSSISLSSIDYHNKYSSREYITFCGYHRWWNIMMKGHVNLEISDITKACLIYKNRTTTLSCNFEIIKFNAQLLCTTSACAENKHASITGSIALPPVTDQYWAFLWWLQHWTNSAIFHLISSLWSVETKVFWLFSWKLTAN